MRLTERYGIILALIAVGYVVDAFDDRILVRFATLALFVLLVVLAILTPRTHRVLRWLGTLGVVTAAALLVASELADENETLRGLSALAMSLTVFIALVSVLSVVGRHERVDGSTILGAVVVYVMIGFGSAFVYRAADLLSSAPFFAQGAGVEETAYTYFSFVTLTTLGFGDLSPGTELAQRLVVVEAMAGQIFLVVLVARLVSMFGESLRAVRGTDGD